MLPFSLSILLRHLLSPGHLQSEVRLMKQPTCLAPSCLTTCSFLLFSAGENKMLLQMLFREPWTSKVSFRRAVCIPCLQLHSSKGPCHVGPLCPGGSRGKQPDSPGPDPVTEGCHFILCPQPGPVTEGHCLTLYRWPEQRLSRDVPLTWLAQRWLLVTQTSLPSRSPFLQPQVEVRQGTTLTVMYLN